MEEKAALIEQLKGYSDELNTLVDKLNEDMTNLNGALEQMDSLSALGIDIGNAKKLINFQLEEKKELLRTYQTKEIEILKRALNQYKKYIKKNSNK